MESQEFLKEFIEEAEDNLQELESSVLALEREGSNREQINRIFRAAHSIKGASAYMGYEHLANLAHELENLFNDIRSRSLEVPPEGFTVLLRSLDFMAQALKHIEKDGSEPPLPPEMLDELAAILKTPSPAGAPDDLVDQVGRDASEASDMFSGLAPADRDPEELLVEESLKPAAADAQPSSEEPSEVSFAQAGGAETRAQETEERPEAEQMESAGLTDDWEEPQLKVEEKLVSDFADDFMFEFPLDDEDYEILEHLDRPVVEVETQEIRLDAIDLDRDVEMDEVSADTADFEPQQSPITERDVPVPTDIPEPPPLPPSVTAPEEDEGVEEIVEEEHDEELFTIFLDSLYENLSALADLTPGSAEIQLSDTEYNQIQELLGRMLSASRYMDYSQVVRLLDTCGERMAQVHNQQRLSGDSFADLLHDFFQRLKKILPKLEIPELPEVAGKVDAATAPETLADAISPEYQELDGEIDQVFAELMTRPFSVDDEESEQEEVATVPPEEPVAPLPSEVFPREAMESWGAKPTEPEPSLEGVIETMARKPSSMTGPTPEPVPPEPTEPQKEAPAGPQPFIEEMIQAVADKPSRIAEPQVEESHEKTAATIVFDEYMTPSVTLRVDAQKVDQLLNQVGELVVTRSEFIQTTESFRNVLRELVAEGKLTKQEVKDLQTFNLRLTESTVSLGRVVTDLQDSVMRVRMLPLTHLFQRFPRVVRDQALAHGKKVELLVRGGDTEIDKRVLEQMYDPLVQLLRNSIAHGIESPADRRLRNKPEVGTIRLEAYHEGDQVVLEVADDGAGIDTEQLKRMLAEQNMMMGHELLRLSDRELMHTIFLPGVSTRERADQSAGRGVGLDVVKENVERMNGSIEVDSQLGEGTRFFIRIPLTVAIIQALLVRGAEQIFTLPLTSVSEILRYDPAETNTIEGFEVIYLRERTIPLVSLDRLLNLRKDMPEDARRFIVIVTTSFREVGLVVEELLGEREVVIKTLDDSFCSFEGFSGATILGDGSISLILDVSALLKHMSSPLEIQSRTFSRYLH